MISLVLDSATVKLYVAIVKDNEVIYEKYQEGKNDHSKYIVSLIEEGLKLNNITVDDLDKVIVGNGPGSYTGVRMALTIGKMFAAFKNIKLYTVSTLFLMGSSLNEISSVRIDARRGNVFGMIYDFKNDSFVKNEGLYPTQEINEGLITTEENFKVDPLKVINKATFASNPDIVVPNYLRDTEAERNLK